MGQAKFEIKKSTNDKFYFNLKAGNGEVILTSEMYESKQNCENGIESVQENAPEDKNYDKKTASSGQYYFNLKASNNKIIGTSEMYESTQGRDNGIESVKTNAPTSEVVYLT